jgi:hypothetical protein
MFEYLELRHKVGVHLDYGTKILDARQQPTFSMFGLWEMTAGNMASSYENAAELAAQSPRQSARVFEAISMALLSPLTTAQTDARLYKAARSLSLPGNQLKSLNRYEGVDSATAPDRFGYTFDMGELATQGVLRHRMYQRAQSWLQKAGTDNPELYTHALCTLAKTGCEFTNWKAGALLDAVAAGLSTPEQLVMVCSVAPKFMQRVAEVGLLDADKLENLLQANWAASDDIKQLSEEYYAEKTINTLHHAIPYEEKLVVAQYAEGNTDFQTRAAAQMIRLIPHYVRSGDGDKAQELLDLLNAVSGKPLAPFNTLASRELYIGPEIFITPSTSGTAPDLTRRTLVAGPDPRSGAEDAAAAVAESGLKSPALTAFLLKFARSHMPDIKGDEIAKFTITHGPVNLGPIDILKLYTDNLNGTDLDRQRRDTFAEATRHLGKSEVSLAAAWGALCVQSGNESTKRLGAKLLVASLKHQTNSHGVKNV